MPNVPPNWPQTLKHQQIGFADFHIAASALEDGAELLSFNHAYFGRVPGLKLAQI